MSNVKLLTTVCGLIAAAVVVDAFGVSAPGLALLAVPSAAAALLLPRAPVAGAVTAVVGCLIVAAVATANIAHGGPEAGVDVLTVYVGGVLALVGLVTAVGVLRAPRLAQG